MPSFRVIPFFKRIPIFGTWYKVRVVKDFPKRLYDEEEVRKDHIGYCDIDNKIIYIKKSEFDKSRRHRWLALFHEAVHGVFDEAGWDQADNMSSDIQQIICEVISRWIFNMFEKFLI